MVAAILCWGPAWRWVRLGATLVHEVGHAVVGILSGRRFTGFVVAGNASGHAITVGPVRGFGRIATTWAGYPAPAVAGLAFVWSAAQGYAAATLVATKLPFLRQVFDTPELWGVLAGGALVCLVGVIDDIRELDPLTKLSGQIVAAGLLAYSGVQLFSLPVLGVTTILPAPLLVLLTILAVLVTTNAVNFIDGLDGLASGVVAIAATAFLAYSYLISRSFDPPNVFSSATFISAALVGCCLGFLPHNFYPARLFMGDSGALLLGLLLAAAMISTTGG